MVNLILLVGPSLNILVKLMAVESLVFASSFGNGLVPTWLHTSN